jgi:hypothetical protein
MRASYWPQRLIEPNQLLDPINAVPYGRLWGWALAVDLEDVS